MAEVDSCDLMRELDGLGEADPRMRFLCVLDDAGSRPITQQDRWKSVAQLALQPNVPDVILVHYDTARNLYLHAWYVYRFHVVAEQQVLSTLEFALRSRLQELRHVDVSAKHKPGLSSLLQSALDHGLISNERLTTQQQWAQAMADRRKGVEQIQYMLDHQLASMQTSAVPELATAEELEHDWVASFIKELPSIRNQYAHGSPTTHATVLRTFEIVKELINQLYEPGLARSSTSD